MKKYIISEKQLNLIGKRLNEMEVQQYEDNGFNQKHFLTPIIPEVFGGILDDTKGSVYIDDKTVLYVDWTMFFAFTESGCATTFKINNILDGVIYYKDYRGQGIQNSSFNFSAKGFKLDIHMYPDAITEIKNLDIDLDKRIIEIS